MEATNTTELHAALDGESGFVLVLATASWVNWSLDSGKLAGATVVRLPIDSGDDAEDAAVEFGMEPGTATLFQNGTKVSDLTGSPSQDKVEAMLKEATAAPADDCCASGG
eukprot:TRINITY_DN10849_c0_g1_i1.p2 TRINITY_DN10849_c0_g1~~TRINITY_DN10849_c0_g1_i1.p2  ORF type:complete len:110 (+),score=30.45 TRINITY_DN10849_c0_g1_i1:202-531(+)